MARKSRRALWAAAIEGDAVKKGGASAGSAALTGVLRGMEGVVLGIDPSLRGTGLAVLHFDKRTQGALVHAEVIKNGPRLSMTECLGEISKGVEGLLERYEVDVVACEETIYVQNFRTAQILGAARGAALGVVAARGCPVFEYPPLRIKQAVVGQGRASKEQVAKTVRSLLSLPDVLSFDESDACAVALCHAFTQVQSI